MLLVPPSHKFRKVKNETVESFMTTKDVVQRVQAAGWPCDHADSEMADGRADGHFGEILQAGKRAPRKWAHRNWWLILLRETPFLETLEISLKMVTKGGMKILISDFTTQKAKLRKPSKVTPRSPRKIRQLSLGLAKPGAADLGCLGGCPSLLRAILSNEHMFHQIDPRGVFEVRNVCGSPSLLVFFCLIFARVLCLLYNVLLKVSLNVTPFLLYQAHVYSRHCLKDVPVVGKMLFSFLFYFSRIMTPWMHLWHLDYY